MYRQICRNALFFREHLCHYLLASNPFMIDAEIMDKKLAQWLDEECGLVELSHQLFTLFRRGSQPGIFAGTILDYVNYCSREDKERIDEVLQNNVGLVPFYIWRAGCIALLTALFAPGLVNILLRIPNLCKHASYEI